MNESILSNSNPYYQQGIKVRTSNVPIRIRFLLPFYKLLQYMLLFGSFAFLIYMRTTGQSLVIYLTKHNSRKWESNCVNTLWMLSGIVYAFSNFGFVSYFLTTDILKSLGKKGHGFRVILKLTIEVIMFLVGLVVLYSVYVHGILDNCANEDSSENVVSEAKTLFAVSLCLFCPYFLSFVIYSYLKWSLDHNENYKAAYVNFLRDKYA